MDQPQPTIVVRIGDSYLGRTASGNIAETVDLDESGQPDWSNATLIDHRGIAGPEGYRQLIIAFRALETNAVIAYDDPDTAYADTEWVDLVPA